MRSRLLRRIPATACRDAVRDVDLTDRDEAVAARVLACVNDALTLEVGAFNVGALQVGTPQVSVSEIGALKVGASEIGAHEEGALTHRALDALGGSLKRRPIVRIR